jgi:hypothetical protein
MGYDKSKNDAVSKALIDASQIIGERGTLSKKNITRELINPIIAATGKRLEKPEQIREAVGLMMAKGEIEKDIAKGKGSELLNRARDLKEAGVFKTEKEALEHLAKTTSITEKAITYANSLQKPIDQEIVIYTMQEQFGSRPKVLMSEDKLEKAQKEDDYESDLVVFEKIKDKKKLSPGHYVIGASGFVINSDGTVKQVLG